MSIKAKNHDEILRILQDRKEEVTIKIEQLLFEFVEAFDGSIESISEATKFSEAQNLLESSLNYINKRIEYIEKK